MPSLPALRASGRMFKVPGRPVRATDGRVCFEGELDLRNVPDANVAIDVYALVQLHPERHLGWWQFPIGARRTRARVEVDLHDRGPDAVRLWLDGAPLAPRDHWVNPDYAAEPVQDLMLVARDGAGLIRAVRHVILVEPDPAVLERYARRVYETAGYAPRSGTWTFFQTFHQARLRVIADLLTRHVPAGSRLLDLGAGYSLFTEPSYEERLARDWRYRIVCCDLAADAMTARQGTHPQHGWLVCTVMQLPFASGTFDAVFAGEILEHVDGTAAALAEWTRVLRPGGTLIVTTPNRGHLANLVQGFDFPIAPDHVNELSFDETRAALRSAGLRVLEERGIYLELLLDWLGRGPNRVDLLRARLDRPAFAPLMRLLMRAGDVVPQLAWSSLFAARKPA